MTENEKPVEGITPKNDVLEGLSLPREEKDNLAQSPFPQACAAPSPGARGKSIKLQSYMVYLILPMVLIPIVLMALLGIWLSYNSSENVNQLFHQSRETELIMIAERPIFSRHAKAMEEMRTSSAQMYQGYFRQWLQQFLDRSNQYECLYVWIQAVDPEGREIVRVGATDVTGYQIPTGQEIAARTRKVKTGAIWLSHLGNIHILSVPVWYDRDENGDLTDDEYLGAVTAGVQYPRSYITYIVTRILIFTGFIMGVALLVSFLTIRRTFRRLVEPILHLSRISRLFASGTLSARIDMQVNVAEIQDMEDAFNAMACDIEHILEERNQYAGQLAKLNEDLERKVRERTRELRRLNRDLRMATRHKSEFLANMSHELRTPLNAIMGFTELIADGIYGQVPPKMTEIMEKIQRNGTHLLNLINDVLDLSKIEAGRIDLKMGDFRPAACIENVVANAASLAARKGLKVITEVPEGLPLGFGDEKRVNQVLWNLVSNAIKFTQQGEVTVGVKSDDGALHFFVNDTGIGIPSDRLEDLFKEFTQLDSSDTKEFGGTGLGLSISRKLVEMHGGMIWAESEEGKGSIFHFILPLKAQPQLASSVTGAQSVKPEGA